MNLTKLSINLTTSRMLKNSAKQILKNLDSLPDMVKAVCYAYYGGQSVNLKQFWKAVNSGMDYEKAAFTTRTGKWAEKNGFLEIEIVDKIKQIKEDRVIIKFLKNKQ